MSDMIVLKIKDRKYGMRKMPPIKGAAFGIRVSSALSKMLAAPGAAEALVDLQKRFKTMARLEDGQSDVQNQEIDTEQATTLGQIIIRLLAQIDADVVNTIFREAFSWEVYYETIRLSDDVQFEEHFAKYPGDLYPVAVWATYNHVKDFFTGLGDGIKAFMTSSENNHNVQH